MYLKDLYRQVITMFASDTVDSITAPLTKAVQRLKTLSEKKRASAAYNRQLVEEYTRAAEDHSKEAERADRVASKIGSLLDDV